MADDLVGTTEIAERLGVAYPETVHSWRRRYDDFPKPITRIGTAYVWRWRDVEAWARKTGRWPPRGNPRDTPVEKRPESVRPGE